MNGINKRKKKDLENLDLYIDNVDYEFDKIYEGVFRNVHQDDDDSPTNTVNDLRSKLASGTLRSKLNKQLNKIQDDKDTRAQSEESNKDQLDRGSRYVRRKDRLKKFNP